MSWWKGDDRLAMSVKVRGLADPGVTGDRAKRQRNEALGHWTQIISWVAGERTDGFVTADIVELFGTTESTARLLRARFDRQPLLHARGRDGKAPDCPCLEGRSWPADYEYALHDYLDRNPSRGENDVHRAKKAELRDAKLKHAVRDRDRDRCRYCGKECRFTDRVSDDGLTFDHVDPERADGINNLVVSCRGCNRKKARRTPEQAGMVLLEPPRASTDFDAAPTAVTGPVAGPDLGHVTGPVVGQVTGLCADQAHDSDPSQGPMSPGRDGGRAGQPSGGRSAEPERSPQTGTGPPDTVRRPGGQSPYLRPQRPYPEHHAGHPPPTEPPDRERHM